MRRRRWIGVVVLTLAATSAGDASAAVREVGPGKAYAKPCAAIAAAKPGDTIRIDARGNGRYDGDVCEVRTARLTIEGVRGRARIRAAGRSSGGKGIWVISGPNTVVKNVELSGAAVPDRNGAGIRVEGEGDLRLVRSYLHHNENGILVTGSAEKTTVAVESSTFADNGAGDGYSHNIYVARAHRFTMRRSASRRTRRGHLVKTRAEINDILHNRLTGEGSTSSYELDIPDGGAARVIGNVIQQGPKTENATLLAFGAESLSNPRPKLTLLHNTFASDRDGPATAVRIGGTGVPVTGANNLLAGIPSFGIPALRGTCAPGDPRFVDRARHDYRLKPESSCRDAGVRDAEVPREQYVYDLGHEPRPTDGSPDAGAFEWVSRKPALSLLARGVRPSGAVTVLVLPRVRGTATITARVHGTGETYARRRLRLAPHRTTDIALALTRAGRSALAVRRHLRLRITVRYAGAQHQTTLRIRRTAGGVRTASPRSAQRSERALLGRGRPVLRSFHASCWRTRGHGRRGRLRRHVGGASDVAQAPT